MYSFVNGDQLPNLERALHHAVHNFQCVPVTKHEYSVTHNAKLSFSDTVFEVVN